LKIRPAVDILRPVRLRSTKPCKNKGNILVRKLKQVAFVGTLVLAFAPWAPLLAHSHEGEEEAAVSPKLETLLRTVLEGVEGTEIIVSRVTIPPNSSLPKHWHPGEEFAYVLEGSITLWQEGKEDIIGVPGDLLKIPLKQTHTAITGEEGGVAIVFRVHEEGQPERVPVEG